MSQFEESTNLEVNNNTTLETSKLKDNNNNNKSFNLIDRINQFLVKIKLKDEDEEIYTPEILNVPKLKYGKYNTFCYINNDPIFAIGPDYLYFIVLFIINVSFDIFILFLIWNNSYYIIKIIGLIMTIIQLLSYLITSIINPGLPKAKYQYYATHSHKGNYKQCINCNLWINSKKYNQHCEECDCCVEGYDHHCPWTSKCVGSKNIYLFFFMVGSIFVLIAYYFFSLLMMTVYINNNVKK